MNNNTNTNTNAQNVGNPSLAAGAVEVNPTVIPATGTITVSPIGTTTAPVTPTPVPTPPAVVPPPPVAPPPAPAVEPPPRKKSHKAGVFIFLLLLIIGGMGYYIYTDYMNDKENHCSPLVSGDTTSRRLDLDSTIVQDLYQKVFTTVREDLAYNTFDDHLKLYLAYRQIPQSKIYDSNCNLFSANMLPFTCQESVEFSPKAFKEETMQVEIKKLFGENSTVAHANVQLGTSCFGGYQYIEERGEYVQGYCKEIPTTIYNAEKELLEASVQGDTITLKEKVRYYSSEGIDSDKLQGGTYVYTFRLDNNYNYAYVNRTIEQS